MNKEAQTQELEQDELNKYPGLHHCIVSIEDDRLQALILNSRTFQKICYICFGDSFNQGTIFARSIKPVLTKPSQLGKAFKVTIQLKRSSNMTVQVFDSSIAAPPEESFIFNIPREQVKFYADIPTGYTKMHSEPEPGPVPMPDTGIPSPGSCNEYDCEACKHNDLPEGNTTCKECGDAGLGTKGNWAPKENPP